jgi:FtsP/CotA-like multicopper oxidase with cupredoxin domain
MVRIGPMARAIFPLSRRELMAGLGAVAFSPALPASLEADPVPALALRAGIDPRPLQPSSVDALFWSPAESVATTDNPALIKVSRVKPRASLRFAFLNDLPVPAELNWHGLDGGPQVLLARPGIARGESQTLEIPLRHSGTLFCDLRLLGDGQARPSRALALVVEESVPTAVDRDEVCLIEDWRLRPDGTPVAPGTDAKDARSLFTVNGVTSLEIGARTHERLRIRFINGCQRNGFALRIEDHEMRVMAIDGQPSEPFLARNGQLVLAPGTRVDAFVDAVRPPGSTSAILLHDGTEPRPIGRLVYSSDAPIRDAPLPVPTALPSNGLPAQLDLKNALRIDLALGGAPADWVTPATFNPASAPAFRAKLGRTVVLALTNRASIPSVLHLHGHHFRLLDRLDDGWKPFWLDTLAIDAGQTQRIALAAEHVGRWLIESFATDWSAPRLVRWYSVE